MKKTISKVYLVGAGPGSPDLISVRGQKLIEECDYLVYDHLVHSSLVHLARKAKEKFYVGKKGRANHQLKQSGIHQLLLKLAKKGGNILRLKGGDPFVFGRGGEEALYLKKYGIPVEIVPGITAGFGALAYAGIPVTHRELASEVTFVTAHEDPSKKNSGIDWKVLAPLKGTLVIFMGLHNLNQIIRTLINHGKSSRTPAAVIHWGTIGNQKTITGTLANISEKARKAKLEAPVITVVGDVVELRNKLAWFEKKPLFGRTIVVTRSRDQSSYLRELLEELGAHVIEFPTIEIHPPSNWEEVDRAAKTLHNYDWIFFTSENGVSYFFNRLKEISFDVRELSGTQIAAVGMGTAKKLLAHGIQADFIPAHFTTRELFREFKEKFQIAKKKFLLLRTNIAPKWLEESLKDSGGMVKEVSVYETRPPQIQKGYFEEMLKKHPIDFITFMSSSTVTNFFKTFSKLGMNPKKLNARFISIGPVTSKTIRELGGKVAKEADPHTMDGLVNAILKMSRKK